MLSNHELCSCDKNCLDKMESRVSFRQSGYEMKFQNQESLCPRLLVDTPLISPNLRAE
jgi:hypothetical protein